ncbi:MAG: metallophosphoesterase [Nanoarchaeota archaeon]|nr:metallophosphoesterase [Nanoarchaeota archaeon]
MNIERFEAVERALFWKEKRVLVIGDLHFGYENYLHERGWSFPKTQISESIEILGKIFQKTGKLAQVIILGDVKHYFGGILNEEFSDVLQFFNLIKENLDKNGEIIIIKGNHDNILEPILKKQGLKEFVKLKQEYILEDILFFHGHKRDFERVKPLLKGKNIKISIIGHFHPAINLEEDAKKEKYKCYLYGKSKILKKELIIVPSFFPLLEGTNILAKDFMLEGWLDVSNFEVFIISDKVYDFGKVSKINK